MYFIGFFKKTKTKIGADLASLCQEAAMMPIRDLCATVGFDSNKSVEYVLLL